MIRALLFTVLLIASTAARAADLYATTVFVTGQGEENRAAGFASALADVLVKVAGDPSLRDDPAATALAAHAGDLVASFRYRDRMAGIPVHDEQGSRDRPFDLTVAFDPGKVDAALAGLGRKPWLGPRPRLALRLTVRNGGTVFALSADGAEGRDMRDALAVEADRLGLTVTLPGTAAGGAAAAAGTGAAALAGTLTWDPARARWTTGWHFADRQWSFPAATFDAAFRQALGDVARIASSGRKP